MKMETKPLDKLQAFLKWPIWLCIILAVTNIGIFFVDVRSGLIMLVTTVICSVFSIALYFYRKPKLNRDLLAFAMDYTQVQKRLLKELPIPYGTLDESGTILWSNRAFTELAGKIRNKNINTLFPEIKTDDFPGPGENRSIFAEKEGRFYRIELKNLMMDGIFDDKTQAQQSEEINYIEEEISLLTVYIFDETERFGVEKRLQDEKLVAGLIYLDNYDEALESIEEVRQTLLVALIDRKINKYITSLGGIVKKMEKDKYFVVVQQKSVKAMQEDRFFLLEDVKTVNIGNEMAVTLSIGLGVNAESYEESYEFAHTAIDLALGRGGDQAVIKDKDSISYYGGKSQSQEKNTRVKARVKAHAMRELLLNKDRVFIMGHKLADIDALGSAIGFYRAATFLDKKAHIVINDITASLMPVAERFKNNPDYPEDMFLTSEQALERVDENSILIVTDVNRPSYTECPPLLEEVGTVVVLDHHRQTNESIQNAVLSYVEPYASSSCEMVAEILQYIGDGLRLKPLEADAMYGGIMIDTNNFLNKTGVRTFEAAAYLRRSGADIVRIRKMFRDKMGDFKARAEAVRTAEIFKDCFAISVCPAEKAESPTVTCAQAANELLNVIGIKASFVLTEYQEKIYISARSIDEVNVQIIMERLGGGGHMSIAGAQLKGCTMEEAKEYLKVTISQMLEEGAI